MGCRILLLWEQEYVTLWMKISSSHFVGTPETQQSEDEAETWSMWARSRRGRCGSTNKGISRKSRFEVWCLQETDRGGRKEVVPLVCERTGSRTFPDIVAEKKIQRMSLPATARSFLLSQCFGRIVACVVIIKYRYFSYISVLPSVVYEKSELWHFFCLWKEYGYPATFPLLRWK